MPGKSSFTMRLATSLVLNSAIVWLISSILPNSFIVGGGYLGLAIVGVVLTVLNFVVRPVLNIVSLPFKLIGGVLVSAAVNVLFLRLLETIVDKFPPETVSLDVQGAFSTIVIAIILGAVNMLIK